MPIEFQLDFHAVGDGERSGDAITCRYRTPYNQAIHVIDGGTKESGENVVEFIRQHYDNPQFIDAVICTHGDDDHSSGLRTIIENFGVSKIYMNRPWLYAGEITHLFDYGFTVEGLRRSLRQAFPILVEIEEIAIKRGIAIEEAFQGTRIGAFTILAPSRKRYLELIPQFSRTPAAAESTMAGSIMQGARKLARKVLNWIPETWDTETLDDFVKEPTSPSNESSVVQYADMGNYRILLTADAGVDALSEAANFAINLRVIQPNIIQVPHHGSRHNVSKEVLNRWLGQPVPEGTPFDKYCYASVAGQCETHPRRKVVNAFKRRGGRVWSTKGMGFYHHESMPRPGWGGAPYEHPFYDQVEE